MSTNKFKCLKCRDERGWVEKKRPTSSDVSIGWEWCMACSSFSGLTDEEMDDLSREMFRKTSGKFFEWRKTASKQHEENHAKEN